MLDYMFAYHTQPHIWWYVVPTCIALFLAVVYWLNNMLLAHTANLNTSLKLPAISFLKKSYNLVVNEHKGPDQSGVFTLPVTSSIAPFVSFWVFYFLGKEFYIENLSISFLVFLFLLGFWPVFWHLITLKWFVVFLTAILSIPFIIYGLIVYFHYLTIKHPLTPYLKSGADIPREAIKSKYVSGKYFAFVLENYRIKTEKLLHKIEQHEAREQRKAQRERERPLRETERKQRAEYEREIHEENERVKAKIKKDRKKYGTQEQIERRKELNKAHNALLNRFYKRQKSKEQ